MTCSGLQMRAGRTPRLQVLQSLMSAARSPTGRDCEVPFLMTLTQSMMTSRGRFSPGPQTHCSWNLVFPGRSQHADYPILPFCSMTNGWNCYFTVGKSKQEEINTGSGKEGMSPELKTGLSVIPRDLLAILHT